MQIALVTCRTFADLHADDQAVAAVLAARGHFTQAVCWDDSAVAWEAFDSIVIRSTWDYTVRVAEFLDWISRATVQSHVWNPANLVRWNHHKTYLRDLRDAGVPVVPTLWLSQGSDIAESIAWITNLPGGAIVKPAIGAGSRGAYLVARSHPSPPDAELRAMLLCGDILVQPFLASVMRHGEVSLIFFRSQFSHAVLKVPAAGDFRVQRMYGASQTRVDPPPDVIAVAERALMAVDGETLYARVDVLLDQVGTALVSEIELIEPSLYLALAPDAVELFADSIVAASEGRRTA